MKKKLIIIFLLFVALFMVNGCNSTKEEKKEEKQEKISDTSIDDEIELYSDNEKLVFEAANMRYVFYYDGEKITGYHVYIDYNSAGEAKTVLDQYPKDESIDKIYTKGKYLIIEYAKSQYENLTVSSVKLAYSTLKEVKK